MSEPYSDIYIYNSFLTQIDSIKIRDTLLHNMYYINDTLFQDKSFRENICFLLLKSRQMQLDILIKNYLKSNANSIY